MRRVLLALLVLTEAALMVAVVAAEPQPKPPQRTQHVEYVTRASSTHRARHVWYDSTSGCARVERAGGENGRPADVQIVCGGYAYSAPFNEDGTGCVKLKCEYSVCDIDGYGT